MTSKWNGICDEQFLIKMHWEIQNYLVCRHNLKIHFDFHFSMARSVWWSCRHYLTRFYAVTISSFNTKFQLWFDFSLFITFHFFSFRQNLSDWLELGSGDCLSLSRLTASHKQSQFEQFFCISCLCIASTCSVFSDKALGNGWSKTTDKNLCLRTSEICRK